MHVLVVENDQFLRRIIAQGLVSEGYQVKTAGNGIDGLREARRALPDILLVGTLLPMTMNGAMLITEFRKLPGADNVKIVLLLNDHPTNGLSGYPTVEPPFGIPELIEAIGALR